jgi:hypothetical protein
MIFSVGALSKLCNEKTFLLQTEIDSLRNLFQPAGVGKQHARRLANPEYLAAISCW